MFPSGIPHSIQSWLLNPFKAYKLINKEKSEPIETPDSEVYLTLAESMSNNKRKTAYFLIVLESLGFTNDLQVNAFVRDLIEKEFAASIVNKKKYKLHRLPNDYRMFGTLGAELRYNCNIKSLSSLALFRSRKADLHSTKNCLPMIAARNNIETSYIHGNMSRFYHRDVIMPMIGYDYVYFNDYNGNWAERIIDCINKPFCSDDIESISRAKSIYLQFAENIDDKTGIFVDILSISSHGPYTQSSNLIESYKEVAIDSIKEFSGLISLITSPGTGIDSFIVITSDHGPYLAKPSSGIDSSEDTEKINFVYAIHARPTDASSIKRNHALNSTVE